MKTAAAVPQLRVGRKHTTLGIPAAGPLRLKRFAAGITLFEAARAAGISASQASFIERGIRTDPEDAAALGAAIEKLVAGGAR